MINSHKETGLSLIELMIAIVIGLFLVVGLIELFTANKQSSRFQEEMSRVQENGRFAIQLISKDVQQADFMGCNHMGLNHEDTKRHIDDSMANANYDPSLHNIAAAVDGDDGVTGTSTALDQSDELTIISVSGNGLNLLAPYPTVATDDLYIAADHSLQQGDIVVIADCRSAPDIFQITNDAQTDGYLRHTLGAFNYLDGGGQTVEEPGNKNVAACTAAGTLNHCLGTIYDDNAIVYRLTRNIYTIATGINGRPALHRNGAELLPNIENMHVLYGEDTTPLDNNINPNSYIPAGGVGAPPNMSTVALAIPSFANLVSDNHLATKHNELLAAISLTRSEAIKRALRISLCQRSNQQNCTKESGNWHQGWIIFVDNDEDNQVDANEQIIQVQQSIENMKISFGSRTRIAYQASGLAVGGSNGTLLFCDSTKQHKKGLIISTTGRTRTATGTELQSRMCP